ncbi:MAG: hypothetical protein ACYCU7_03215 [Acidimicrobiales bacterium]
MTTYGTDRETSALAALAELLPDVELVNPAGRYPTANSWLQSWPRLVVTLSGLVVFGDHDGTIGAGCVKELADAWRLQIPVAVFDDGRCRQLTGLRVLPNDVRSGLRTAVLIPGRRVRLAEMIGGPM